MDNLNEKLSNEAQSQPSCLGAVSGSILSHKQILDNKMSWSDIVKHHLPNSSEDDIESIFNWCYNRASAMEGTSNPKNYTILDSFQNVYLKLD
jgi:hypothetical protein